MTIADADGIVLSVIVLRDRFDHVLGTQIDASKANLEEGPRPNLLSASTVGLQRKLLEFNTLESPFTIQEK